MNYKICIGLLLGFAVLGTSVNSAEVSKSSNVELTNIRETRGKGYFSTVQISLKNISETPKWFILLDPNRILDDNTIFPDKKYKETEKAFYLWCYSYENKHLMQIICTGMNGFSAFLLKPQSEILLNSYTYHYFEKYKFVEIFEAKSFLINGKQAIEELLPVENFANVSISLSPDIYNVGLSDGTIEKEETKLKLKDNIEIKSITLVDAKKYYFPIEKVKPRQTTPTVTKNKNVEGLGGGNRDHPPSQ